MSEGTFTQEQITIFESFKEGKTINYGSPEYEVVKNNVLNGRFQVGATPEGKPVAKLTQKGIDYLNEIINNNGYSEAN